LSTTISLEGGLNVLEAIIVNLTMLFNDASAIFF